MYVEGGNTFWLAHCIKEGDWSNILTNAVAGTRGDDDMERENAAAVPPAVYIGKSAGAIIAGKYIETATWKEWDDPSVVPGMTEYSDWIGAKGLGLVDACSFFPHMSSDWEDLVQTKKKELGTRDEEYDTILVEAQK